MVEGNSDLTKISTDGINDSGQIVGTAAFLGGRGHAVLLTPTGSAAWKALGTGGSFSDVDNWEQGFSPSKFINAVIAPAGTRSSKRAATRR